MMETERVKLGRKRIVDLCEGDTFRMDDGRSWETVKGWSESANLIYLHTTAGSHGWRRPPAGTVVVVKGENDDG